MRLPVLDLFVTGGALVDQSVRDELLKLTVPLATARVGLVEDFEFSGATL